MTAKEALAISTAADKDLDSNMESIFNQIKIAAEEAKTKITLISTSSPLLFNISKLRELGYRVDVIETISPVYEESLIEISWGN